MSGTYSMKTLMQALANLEKSVSELKVAIASNAQTVHVDSASELLNGKEK